MTVEARELPSMTSPLWDDPQIVLAQPVYGCPGCPACLDPGDRSAELFWWKQAVT